MSIFPKPPTIHNRDKVPEVAPEPTILDSTTIIDKQILVKETDSLLTDDEVDLILKTSLRADQYKDVQILRFIMKYLECRNATQSAEHAGFPNPAQKGYYLKGRPEIFTAIEKLTQKSVMKYGYDAHEVIERVKEIAQVDPIAFENPDGSFKTHLSLIDPEVRRGIKKFKAKNIWGEDVNGMRTVIGQLIEVEMFDKLKASELLGREKNIMKETKKVEHDVTANMASVLLASQARANARVLEAVKSVDQVRDVIEITGKIESDGVGDV